MFLTQIDYGFGLFNRLMIVFQVDISVEQKLTIKLHNHIDGQVYMTSLFALYVTAMYANNLNYHVKNIKFSTNSRATMARFVPWLYGTFTS